MQCNLVSNPKKRRIRNFGVQHRPCKLVVGITDLSYSKRLKTPNFATAAQRRNRKDVFWAFWITQDTDDLPEGFNMFNTQPRCSAYQWEENEGHMILSGAWPIYITEGNVSYIERIYKIQSQSKERFTRKWIKTSRCLALWDKQESLTEI